MDFSFLASHTFPEVGVKVCIIGIGRDRHGDPFSPDELKIKVDWLWCGSGYVSWNGSGRR